MGWTGYPEYRDMSISEYWKQIYLPKIPNWIKAEPNRYSLVAENSYGQEHYAAIHDNKHNTTFAVVVLLKKDNGYLWEKEMDSSMGPCYYHPSQKVLNALTPPVNEWDKEWRDKCRATIESKALQKTIKDNDIIHFNEPLYIDGKPFSTFRIISKKENLFTETSHPGTTFRIREWKNRGFTIVNNTEKIVKVN